MGVLFEAKELCYAYHKDAAPAVFALEKINLRILEGEFVAIVGTNGSGKSTLAKHFNALLVPTAGACFVAGMDTREEKFLWDIRRTVGMVFQNPDNQLVATMVEEDVAFGPENLGLLPQSIQRQVTEALQAVGMEEFRERSPYQLSGGQKQRVAIAGALAMQTKCLVLDEPTAMLDPKGRREVLATVRRLHEERKLTIVYITHFMEEAAAADRVLVLRDGRLILQGTPRELFSKVQTIKALGLSVPTAAEAAYELRQAGVALPEGILTEEELAVALCRYC